MRFSFCLDSVSLLISDTRLDDANQANRLTKLQSTSTRMDISSKLLKPLAAWSKSRFIARTKTLQTTQEKFLFKLLSAHQNTKLGQEFKLNTIKTVAQFQEQVPIWPYSTYEPYTERIAAGESNVLNPDPVVYINLTSGSTGKKKQVPVTRQFQRSLQSANLASIGFLFETLEQSKGSMGKILVTNCAIRQGCTSSNIEYGPVSVGSLRQQSKILYRHSFAPPFDALLVSDTLARHYICLLFALRDSSLKGIVTNFPMLVLRTCRYLEGHAESLIQDLAAGTIAPWLNLDPDLRASLEQRWSASPKRAEALQTVLKSAGRLTPELAWPDLSFVMTAMGGTSGFYFEQFPTYFGQTPIFGGLYGTAEGHFGIYHRFNDAGSILAIDSGFFEFIPADQWEADSPKTLLPEQVIVGDRYRILVTSYSGFYRYDIGDVVEVVGFYNQAPLIKFCHRRGGLLSSTTEKTTEYHVTEVMQRLQQEFNLNLEDFCVTLGTETVPSRYVVNIELANGSILSNPETFLAQFEQWMGIVNEPYRTVRQSDVPAPTLRILKPGSFAQVRQRQVNRGMFDSQLKIPHISEDRAFLEGLSIEKEMDWTQTPENTLKV